MHDLSDSQLLRYSRHVLLPEIGVEGQRKLLDSSVLVVGLGGLGSPVAMYLAASGVGRLIIADADRVELSNLQRQIIHFTDAVGRDKTDSARRTLRMLSPETAVEAVCARLDSSTLPAQLARADVVVDGCDNFETRHAVNRACVETGKPLVSGAVIRMEGQVSVFAATPDAPCYECLYPAEVGVEESCVQSGVLAPVAGVVGAVQAVETIKVLLDVGEALVGRLLLLDAARMEWRSLKIPKNPACPVCVPLRKEVAS